MNHKYQKPLALAAVASLSVTLAACGQSDAASSSADSNDPVVVNFGSFSSGTASRQVLYAEEAGYFDEEGIDLQIETQQSTANLAQLTATGDVDLSYLTYQPAISALSSGVDIRVLSTVQSIEPGMQTLWSAEDSDIDSLQDLAEAEGDVAVASVGGFQEMLTKEALEDAGLDPESVEFIGVSPTEMISALERGDVAAAGLTPPSRAGALIDDASKVREFHDFSETSSVDGLVQGGLWANGDFYDSNQETVEAFMRAVNRAAEDLEEDPEMDEQYLAELGNLEPDLAAEMVLETWVGDATVDETQAIIDLMVKHEMLGEGAVDASDIVAE